MSDFFSKGVFLFVLLEVKPQTRDELKCFIAGDGEPFVTISGVKMTQQWFVGSFASLA
jgi:hypothetical protein